MQYPKGRFASVDLHHLDWSDDRFAVPAFHKAAFLERSLAEYGLLFPPWLLEKKSCSYVIVDGFKRLRCLEERRVDRAECIIFPCDTDVTQLMLLRIEGKLNGSQLNPTEKAHIILKLCEATSDDQIMRRCLLLLGVPPRMDVAARWCRLAKAPTELLLALSSGLLSERAALELAGWDGEEDVALEVVSIFEQLRCSASIQMEILEGLTDVTRRDKRKMLDVLRDPALIRLLKYPDLNTREKLQALRHLIRSWRYPRLTARENRFRQDFEMAGLPGSIRLFPPPAFEGEGWYIQVSFSSPEDLRELLEKAREYASSPHLNALMNPSSLQKHNSGNNKI